MKFLSKRFLMSAVGALGLAALARAADDGKTMPEASLPAVTSGQPCGLDGGNGPCCCAEGCESGWHLIGGADLLLLRPTYNNDPAFVTTTFTPGSTKTTGTTTTTIAGQSSYNETDFGSKWSASPRIWLGAESCSGLGFEIRWFRFDQTEQATGFGFTKPPLTPGGNFPTTTVTSDLGNLATSGGSTVGGTQTGALSPLFASERLFIQTWDVEATARFQANGCFGAESCWNLRFTGGVRYAYIEHDYNATLPGTPITTNPTTGGGTATSTTVGSENWRQTFSGGGPTVSFDAARKLGDSHLSLVADIRGSLLYGRGHVNENFAADSTTVDTEPGKPTATTHFLTGGGSNRSNFDLLPILEVELGAEWSRRMGNFELFFRPTLVSQTYFNAGNTFIAPGNFFVPAAVGAHSGNYGLIGADISTGVRF
jgi:hypothetical protein